MRITIYILLMTLCSGSFASEFCEIVASAKVIANDGKYLGELSNEYSSDSIFNEYGAHGSEYSSDSIWNEYGTYGGKYSSESPFNKYASTPPMLIKDNKIIGYLSVNEYIKGAVNPFVLKACEFY